MSSLVRNAQALLKFIRGTEDSLLTQEERNKLDQQDTPVSKRERRARQRRSLTQGNSDIMSPRNRTRGKTRPTAKSTPVIETTPRDLDN